MWRQSVSGKPVGEDGRGEPENEMSKAGEVESSLSERPGHHRPRRLVDWINPTGARKVHSLIDKASKRKNLKIAIGPQFEDANLGRGRRRPTLELGLTAHKRAHLRRFFTDSPHSGLGLVSLVA
jgi:hypothetical protein